MNSTMSLLSSKIDAYVRLYATATRESGERLTLREFRALQAIQHAMGEWENVKEDAHDTTYLHPFPCPDGTDDETYWNEQETKQRAVLDMDSRMGIADEQAAFADDSGDETEALIARGFASGRNTEALEALETWGQAADAYNAPMYSSMNDCCALAARMGSTCIDHG